MGRGIFLVVIVDIVNWKEEINVIFVGEVISGKFNYYGLVKNFIFFNLKFIV